MMLSIMSLIRETLSSNSSSSGRTQAHGSAALKLEHPEEFDAMLSQVPPAHTPANSMARIKTKTPHQAHDENGDDSPDSTKCMSPDDFMAWAFNAKSATQTIPAPELARTNSETVPMMNAVQPNGLGPTSSFEGADTKTMHKIVGNEMELEDDSEIQPQASILEPRMGEERVSIGKLARSKNATEVPPPSVLPMVDADDVAPTTARYEPTTAERHQATATNAAPPINAMNAPRDIHELPTRPEIRARSNQPRAIDGTDRASNAAVKTDAALLPLPPLMHSSPDHDTLVAMPRVQLPKDSGSDASDARQQAAAQAVNQLTLKKAAEGELDIPGLGKVRVGAETRGGEVDVRIQADHQDTRALVALHARDIAADARNAAIPVADVRVAGSRNGNFQMNFSSSQDHSQKRNDPRRDDEMAENIATTGYSKRARFVL